MHIVSQWFPNRKGLHQGSGVLFSPEHLPRKKKKQIHIQATTSMHVANEDEDDVVISDGEEEEKPGREESINLNSS